MPEEHLSRKLELYVNTVRNSSSVFQNERANDLLEDISSRTKINNQPSEPKEFLKYDENYSYNHLAVFENQLIPPSDTYLINHGFEEW